jgi:hypothetical protein
VKPINFCLFRLILSPSFAQARGPCPAAATLFFWYTHTKPDRGLMFAKMAESHAPETPAFGSACMIGLALVSATHARRT